MEATRQELALEFGIEAMHRVVATYRAWAGSGDSAAGSDWESRRALSDDPNPYGRSAFLMRRGELRLVDLESVSGSESDKRRPAVIVTNDGANLTADRLGSVLRRAPLALGGRGVPARLRGLVQVREVGREVSGVHDHQSGGCPRHRHV